MTAKTDTTPYHGHFALYLSAFITAMLLFAGSTAMALHSHVASWEVSLFHAINNWPDSLATFFKIVTITSQSLWIAAAAVLLTFVFRMWRLSWRLAVCTVGGSGVVFLAKHFVARQRPGMLLENVHMRVHETDMGFPSGHTMMITVIMLAILPYLPWKWRWIVPIPIVLMALSRMYLGVHFPLDIVGGFAVGVAAVSFVRILPQPLKVLLRLD